MQTGRARVNLPLIAMILTVIIWGSNNIVAKFIIREASPLLIALVRFSVAAVLFHLPVFLILHRGEQRFERRDWPRLMYLGMVCVVGSLVLHLIGLRTTPATDAAIYGLTTPLFVLIFACLLLGERLTRLRALGIGLAFVGAVLLVTGGVTGLGGGDLTGALSLLTGSMIWSTYTLLSKEVLARRSPLLVLAAANIGAGVAVWPIAAVFGVLDELPSLLTWSPTAWWVMVYLVVLMSTTSQLFYVWAIRGLPTHQVSALLYTQPLCTALWAAGMIGELPTVVTVASGLLILAGVWLVNRPAAARARTARWVGPAATAEAEVVESGG